MLHLRTNKIDTIAVLTLTVISNSGISEGKRARVCFTSGLMFVSLAAFQEDLDETNVPINVHRIKLQHGVTTFYNTKAFF